MVAYRNDRLKSILAVGDGLFDDLLNVRVASDLGVIMVVVDVDSGRHLNSTML